MTPDELKIAKLESEVYYQMEARKHDLEFVIDKLVRAEKLLREVYDFGENGELHRRIGEYLDLLDEP